MPQLRRVCTPLGEISYTLTRKKVKTSTCGSLAVRCASPPGRGFLARCNQMVGRNGQGGSILPGPASKPGEPVFLPNCPAEGDVILFRENLWPFICGMGLLPCRGDSLSAFGEPTQSPG